MTGKAGLSSSVCSFSPMGALVVLRGVLCAGFVGGTLCGGAALAAHARQQNMVQPAGSQSAASQSAPVPSRLPNGVSALTETYQDWRLMCQADVKGQAHCVVSQDILTTNRQHLLSMRFQPQGMQIRGEAIVPFNLDLSKGVSVLTDGKPVGDIYSFSTCLPVGCIVPMDMDESQLSTLEKSQKISVSVTFLSGRVLQVPLSPRGLFDAMQRAVALSK